MPKEFEMQIPQKKIEDIGTPVYARDIRIVFTIAHLIIPKRQVYALESMR